MDKEYMHPLKNKDFKEGFQAGYEYALGLNHKNGSVDHERVKNFIAECCVLGINYEVVGLDLYENYIEYCKINKHHHLKIITFYRKIENILDNKIKRDRFKRNGKRVRGFKGIDFNNSIS